MQRCASVSMIDSGYKEGKGDELCAIGSRRVSIWLVQTARFARDHSSGVGISQVGSDMKAPLQLIKERIAEHCVYRLPGSFQQRKT